MKQIYLQNVQATRQLLENVQADEFSQKLEEALALLTSAATENKPILVCGNGGSASDALHITGELVGKFLLQRRAINAVCLSTNASVLTAWANDVDYETVFSRQVEAHAQPGAVLWAISTSGNSPNVVSAAKTARALGVKVLGMTGEGGGKLAEHCDVLLAVPSKATPRIQEVHLVWYHYLCEALEAEVAKSAK